MLYGCISAETLHAGKNQAPEKSKPKIRHPPPSGLLLRNLNEATRTWAYSKYQIPFFIIKPNLSSLAATQPSQEHIQRLIAIRLQAQGKRTREPQVFFEGVI